MFLRLPSAPPHAPPSLPPSSVFIGRMLATNILIWYYTSQTNTVVHLEEGLRERVVEATELALDASPKGGYRDERGHGEQQAEHGDVVQAYAVDRPRPRVRHLRRGRRRGRDKGGG